MTAIEESFYGPVLLLRPLLLNLRSEVRHITSPPTQYNELLDLTFLREDGAVRPLVKSSYLLSTQTKTEAKPESDDDD